MKFAEYEKLFLEEYKRIYYPNSSISLTGLFEHLVVYVQYTTVYGLFTGFLLGFQTMNQKRIEDISSKFMSKFVRIRDKDIEY